MGIIVKDTFLAHFDEKPKPTAIWPGRSGKLALRGREGALDIVVAYFHTGAEISELDLYGVHPDHAQRCTTFPALREHFRSRLGQALARAETTLTVLGGDFNWVVTDADRRSLATAETSGRRDQREENHFQSVVGRPFGLHEMHQSEMTHASASARSRLDRFYCNHHVVEQLDREVKAVALEWKPSLSHYRALLFSRRAPHKFVLADRGLSQAAIKHEDFARRTALAFQD